MSSLPGRLAALLLPTCCFLCGAAARGSLLCAGCSQQLPRLPAALCPVCALPSPEGAVCGACLRHPPYYDATVAAYVYDFPLDRLVQALKYRAALAVAPFLGAALARQPPPTADVIVPLPLHAARLRERGFNQAVEIARIPARCWRLPLELARCSRSHDGAPQASLPQAQRRRNVRHAFLCTAGLQGRHVAVVDDVMTTGATLDEFARALKKAGAARVTNLVVARAL